MAARFDAAGDLLTSTAGLPAASPLTVTCWIHLDVDRNAYTNFWAADSAGADVGRYLGTASNGTTMRMEDSAEAGPLTGPAMTVGAWYGAAIVINGTNWTMHHRTEPGSLITVTAAGVPVGAAITSFVLGGHPNYPSDWLNGRIAAFKVWAAALSQAECAAELAQYAPVRTADLNRYYPLQTDAQDHSGNGRHLTAGATAVAWVAGPSIPDGAPTEATAALSGSGTLSTDQRIGVARAAGLSGTGSLSTTQRAAVSRAAALGGSGSLTAGSVAGVTRAAALSGAGTLNAAPRPGVTRAAALSGSGTLAATGSTDNPAALSGSGSLAAVVVPKTATLVDAFPGPSVDPGKWTTKGTVSIVDGRLRAQCTDAYSEADSATVFDLTNSAMWWEMPVVAGPGGSLVDTYGGVSDAPENHFAGWLVRDGVLHVDAATSGSPTPIWSTPYDPVAHRWLRLRGTGTGTVLFDTSPDGVTWTQQASWTPPWSVTRVTEYLGSGWWGSAPTGSQFAEFDNLNVPIALGGLSGSGTLATTQRLAVARAVALTGAGTLSTTQRVAVARAAALSSVGTLSTTQRLGINRVAALTGSGALFAEVFGFAVSLLSGSGSLTTGAQRLTARQSAALSGVGSLAVPLQRPALVRAVALIGAGSLTVVTPAVPVGASLTGEGHLSTFVINLLKVGTASPHTIRLGGIMPRAIYRGSTLVWKP